jgi:1-acyl-sn-glycerol-3-phosphate acyltransferase
MFKSLSKFILKCAGWKAIMKVKPADKCLICVAPHTSNWDFLLGEIGYTSVGYTANFLIKNEWLKPPIGWLMKSLGAIGVDRKKNTSLVKGLVEKFRTMDHIHLAITPEGTRSLNRNWKKGIYHIAKEANIPIVLVYIDYAKKEICFAEVFHCTDDEKADWDYIRGFYQNITPKYPELFATGLEK